MRVWYIVHMHAWLHYAIMREVHLQQKNYRKGFDYSTTLI